MDPINPWLDPLEVRHLAEQLLRPVPPARLAAADPGFAESFVGFTSPSEVAPGPIPTGAHQALRVSEPISAETTPSAPSPSRFLDRIEIFRDWLAKNFKATDIFILNSEGKVIFDESGRERLHLLARNFATASCRRGDVRVKIGPGAVLELIPCDSHQGRIVLGTLVSEALPPSHVLAITEELIQTALPA
jgi:hypothetical protein